MGHYQSIKFTCRLSELGEEILKEAIQVGSWIEIAKLHPEYPFLEIIGDRIATHGRYDSGNQNAFLWSGDEIKDGYWSVDHEFKYDAWLQALIKFLLPFIIKESVQVKYWFESIEYPYDRHYERIFYPKDIKIDWGRKFGDPAGFEVGDY